MGIYTLIPVQEAFCIDGITDLQIFNSLVNIAVLVTQIRLNQEGVGFAIAGNVEVQVVALRTGTIVVVQIRNIAVSYTHLGNSSASSRLPLLFFPVLLIGNSISYFMSEIFKIILSFFHNRNEGKMFVHPVTHDVHGLALKKECALAHSRAGARLL